MAAIPLSTQTIYAELLQQLRSARSDPPPASLSRRDINGGEHVYAVERHGAARRQRYLGPAGRAETQEAAESIRHATSRGKERRKLVGMLRSAGVSTPATPVCRVLDALSRERLFEPNRLVLVGTLAYGVYPLVLGQSLTASALTTNDIDLSVMPLAVTAIPEKILAPAILERGDPTLEPDRASAPPSRFRSHSGLIVEFLTTSRRSETHLQAIANLGVSAEALPYMDFLVEDNIEAAIAWQDGVLIRVPAPARYAVHKLIVAQRRPRGDPKRTKDLTQARELMALFQAQDPAQWEDVIDLARGRGKKWAAAVDAGLDLVARYPAP